MNFQLNSKSTNSHLLHSTLFSRLICSTYNIERAVTEFWTDSVRYVIKPKAAAGSNFSPKALSLSLPLPPSLSLSLPPSQCVIKLQTKKLANFCTSPNRKRARAGRRSRNIEKNEKFSWWKKQILLDFSECSRDWIQEVKERNLISKFCVNVQKNQFT